MGTMYGRMPLDPFLLYLEMSYYNSYTRQPRVEAQ
jgi:hypothetical protein